jgi:hypothetical protein
VANRVRRVSMVLTAMVLLSTLSSVQAAETPPIDQPDTVGDWCKLTAFLPNTEGSGVRGKSNFSCSGTTNIREYSTQLRYTYNNGPFNYANTITQQAFTATGGVTYYQQPWAACPNDGYLTTSQWDVYTHLRYIDPRTGQSILIWTTGPVTGRIC